MVFVVWWLKIRMKITRLSESEAETSGRNTPKFGGIWCLHLQDRIT